MNGTLMPQILPLLLLLLLLTADSATSSPDDVTNLDDLTVLDHVTDDVVNDADDVTRSGDFNRSCNFLNQLNHCVLCRFSLRPLLRFTQSAQKPPFISEHNPKTPPGPPQRILIYSKIPPYTQQQGNDSRVDPGTRRSRLEQQLTVLIEHPRDADHLTGYSFSVTTSFNESLSSNEMRVFDVQFAQPKSLAYDDSLVYLTLDIPFRFLSRRTQPIADHVEFKLLVCSEPRLPDDHNCFHERRVTVGNLRNYSDHQSGLNTTHACALPSGAFYTSGISVYDKNAVMSDMTRDLLMATVILVSVFTFTLAALIVFTWLNRRLKLIGSRTRANSTSMTPAVTPSNHMAAGGGGGLLSTPNHDRMDLNSIASNFCGGAGVRHAQLQVPSGNSLFVASRMDTMSAASFSENSRNSRMTLYYRQFYHTPPIHSPASKSICDGNSRPIMDDVSSI